MVLITIVNGVYKPTNIIGGAHIVEINVNQHRLALLGRITRG